VGQLPENNDAEEKILEIILKRKKEKIYPKIFDKSQRI